MSALPATPRRRSLGASGIEVSALAWGMWRTIDAGFGADELTRLIHAALDAGIDLLDTADIYGFDGKAGFGASETLLGDALRADMALRKRIVIATKGGICPPLPYDQSRAYMDTALDASLARLGVERVDLYQIHRPDILTHPQELAGFLDGARVSGKIGAVGVSNFTIAQIDALAALLDTPLATTQPEMSPLRIDALDNGEMDQAMRMGLTPLAWSPLGGGRLMRPVSTRDRAVAAELDKVAAAAGVDRAVAAYGWLMAHPAGVIPIVGSQDRARLRQASAAVDMRWTREDWYAVFTAARGELLP